MYLKQTKIISFLPSLQWKTLGCNLPAIDGNKKKRQLMSNAGKLQPKVQCTFIIQIKFLNLEVFK